MFGGTSQFSFGSTAPSNPFGATSTAAAPANTGFLFGSTGAAAPGTVAPTALNSTFTFGNPAANVAAPAPAASQPLTFGTGLQTASTIRPFGSTTTFGATQPSVTPVGGTTGFGGTSLFGASQPAPQPTSLFGATTSTFGAAQPTQTTTMFGSTLAAPSQMGTTVKYEAVAGQDTMRTKNNTFQTINTKLQCITAMKEYLNKSTEELRMEDYQANRKFPAATSMFGATNFSSGTTFSASPFAGGTSFSTAPIASTTSSIFGTSAATTPSSFPTSAAPFSFATNTAAPASTSLFGAPAATTTSPFGIAASAAPATGSIFGVAQPTSTMFGTTTTTSPFGVKPATTQSAFGVTTAQPAFSFGAQPAASTSLFSQQSTASPFGSNVTAPTTNMFGVANPAGGQVASTANPFGVQQTTNIFGASTSSAAPVFGAATSTPSFTGFGSTAPASTTTNIFGAPAVSSSTTAPLFGGFGTQTMAPTSAPFSFNATGTAPTLFGSTAPATSTPFAFNPQPLTGFGMSQAQTAATGTQPFSFSTPFATTTTMATGFGAPNNAAQAQVQQQNVQPSLSVVQQRFLAASLLDPYATRGKKDFSDTGPLKPPTDSIVVSSSSSSTSVTTSTSSPVSLPVQSNPRKTSSARPLVDIRFKLKAVSSSSTPNTPSDAGKSPSQQQFAATGSMKSPLAADFSEEEELALIGKNKPTKLRLSTDFIESSYQSDSIRTLYPLKRLAELETLANMINSTNIMSTTHTVPTSTSSSTSTIDTASAYVSSTTMNNEQTLHPSAGNRAMLPLHHSTPLIVHKLPSPPTSHLSSTTVQSPTSPPAPSTTPPPTSITSNPRAKQSYDNDYRRASSSSKSHSDPRAYRPPVLTRTDYYMKPSTSELKSMFDDHGQCNVKEFTVGHEVYGSVTFYGRVNVAGLDLDRIIEINRHEVIVYPDETIKPPEGEELNIPARITLFDVYPTDRTTREKITDVERIKAMQYGDYLRDITRKFDGEFINYGPHDGSWTFTVKHFTRYGLDGSEDDFVVVKPPGQKQAAAAVAATGQVAKPISTNFLDQTIALNDTYALSSPKSQAMDMEEKENSASMAGRSQHLRLTNQSLIGLRPHEVERLAQSMFCDDADDDLGDDFEHFQQAHDPMITSTKIITSNNRFPPPHREPIVQPTSVTRIDADRIEPARTLAFNAPVKPVRDRSYAKLPKNVANVRGKYFRTNFSPSLQYASVDSLNEARLLLQTPMNFDEQTGDELENFFDLYFSSCAQEISGDSNVPLFQVRQTEDVVQHFIDFYANILDDKHIDDNPFSDAFTAFQLQVLELCRLLWGPVTKPSNVHLINPDYFDAQSRRKMLSHWLYQAILSQPREEQWAMQNCEFLSRGLFSECVKFAHDEGDLRLAALVHAASGSNHVRDILRHCAHEDIVDVYSKDFQRTIAVLSGEFIVKGDNLVDHNRTISWQMALALHLWFANSTSDTISTIVRDFETAFHDQYWLEPVAQYGNSRAHDLRWRLLKLYTDDTYPMDHVFDVFSYTPNPFDYRLSWILYVTLQSLGSYPLSVENDACLHMNFARQLEQLGFWKWSIFVVLHIKEPINRKKLLDEFLHRHVTSTVDLTEDEQMLVDKYNLPLNEILAKKAQRAEYDKQWMNAVHLWIDAKQWRRAHDTYCSYVFHETLLKGNYQSAKEKLDSLDHQRAMIAHWNRRGGFARQYIELLITAEKVQHGQISLTNRAQTSLMAQVHRLCDQLADVIAEKYFKKISLVDISRRLLSLLNYSIICFNLPHLTNDNEENLSRKLHLFHQSVVSSVPCSLPMDLLLEQIDFKHRSHRH